MKPKLLRITTVPISMNILLKGQLAYMNSDFEVHGATTYDEKHFNEVAQRENVTMHQVAMKRTIAPFADLKSLLNLFRLIRSLKPEIVHTHTPKAGLLGMIAAKMAGVPVRMHTVAGLPLVEAKGANRKLLNQIEKLTYKCAHRVYPNSFGLVKIINENHFCDPSKIKVIANGSSNGIDTSHFAPKFTMTERDAFRKSIGIAETDIVFCFVGRLCKEKGIAELVNAFLSLECGEQTPKLLLVGPFERENGVLDAETVNVIKSAPNILEVGRHDDIRPYLEIADVFVFPSYREGFPNVVLQAGAMGLPSIVSNINGCNEIVIDGYNGLIVPVKNTELLAKAMQDMLQKPDLRKQFAAVSRENVVAKYEQKMVWEALLAEYDNMLKKSKQ